MQILNHHIIVKVPTVFLDETRYKGIGLKPIAVDITFNPERHIRYWGEVVSVPTSLPRVPVSMISTGQPGYHEYSRMDFKSAEDIHRQIRIGDKAYFHYNCLLPDLAKGKFSNMYFMFSRKEMENGKEVPYHYYRVKYDLVFAVVRYERVNDHYDPWQWFMEADSKPFTTPIKDEDHSNNLEKRYIYAPTGHIYRKEIQMIGSWTLVEPDMETWDDISIPTPEVMNGKPLVDTMGKPIMKPKEKWLVSKSVPGKKYLRGWVRYVGSSLIGDDQQVFQGMYVYFRPSTDTVIRFEGFDYFRMIQRNIIMWEPEKSQLLPKEVEA